MFFAEEGLERGTSFPVLRMGADFLEQSNVVKNVIASERFVSALAGKHQEQPSHGAEPALTASRLRCSVAVAHRDFAVPQGALK